MTDSLLQHRGLHTRLHLGGLHDNQLCLSSLLNLYMLLFCSQMVVEWTTADATTPVVMYGTSSASLSSMMSATTKTYNASSFCGAPANSTGYVNPGMLHTATLSNLSYNTRYYYQYGDMVSLSLHGFKRLPPPLYMSALHVSSFRSLQSHSGFICVVYQSCPIRTGFRVSRCKSQNLVDHKNIE